MNYPSRAELLNYIEYGFKNIYQTVPDKSATNPTTRHFVETLLNEGLENNQYAIVTSKQSIVSAIGAIPKNKYQISLNSRCQ